jgi:hypothetical protein
VDSSENFHSPFYNSPLIMILIGGALEFSMGLIYFIMFHDGLFLRLQNSVEIGYLSYNPIFIFDFCFIMDFILGFSSFGYFFYLIKVKPRKSRRNSIQRILMIMNIVVLPLSGFLDVVFHLILT